MKKVFRHMSLIIFFILIIAGISNADTDDVFELSYSPGISCGQGIGPMIEADIDGDGVNDTMVVIIILTGSVYKTTFNGDGMLYMTASECTADNNARIKINFVDMLYPGFNPDNDQTWMFKSVPALRIYGSTDSIPVVSPAVMNIYAYRGLDQTDRVDPIYGSLTGPGTKVFSDSFGIMEIFVRTGFAENNLETLILMAVQPNTPAGADVTADLENGSVMFSQVTIPGNTFIEEKDSNAPLPGDMVVCAPWPAPPYFEVETNASTSSPDQVCINYPGTCNETDLKLLTYRTMCGLGGCSSYWSDVTDSLNTVSNTICGDGGYGPYLIAMPLGDYDGDGYLNDVDCNDDDTSVHPGAAEICDNQDNDCDGSEDEGFPLDEVCLAGVGACEAFGITVCSENGSGTECNATAGSPTQEICDGIDNDCNGIADDNAGNLYYMDFDQDGYGDQNDWVRVCNQPSGYITDNTDCDDNDGSEHPNQTWYKDTDNDGYSNGMTNSISCPRPVGYKTASELTALSGDCDDNIKAINPAAIEICDGKDNNCNGAEDEGVANTYYNDNDKDGYGDPNNSLQACDPPLGSVADNTDCDDGDLYEHPNQTWYKDTDNDGYSDGTTNTTSCMRPQGYKAEEELTEIIGDCDDNRNDLQDCNTPVNGDEPVEVADDAGEIIVTFPKITEGGETTITVGECENSPNGINLAGTDPICVQIETSAAFIGDAEVCIQYDDTDMTLVDEINLKMVKCHTDCDNPANWELIPPCEVDYTIDWENNILCACTKDFSDFAVGTPIDSDGDYTPDLLDNCPGVYNIFQEDSDEDDIGDLCDNCPNFHDPTNQCQGACMGDMENDNDVDGSDLNFFVGAFGFSSGDPKFSTHADFNKNGTVDQNDLSVFAEKFGKLCSE